MNQDKWLHSYFFGRPLVFCTRRIVPAGRAERNTLKQEAIVQVDGKYADAALGRFSTAGDGPEYIAALEGKGPRDSLDRATATRSMSSATGC
jgi:hypothetical protein